MESLTNQLKPAKFSDAKGREFVVRLDFVKLRAIRAQTSIDLGDLAKIGMGWAELRWHDQKALDAVWLAISENGKAAEGATQDDWLAAMDGELLEKARDALSEAIENFTPPLKRTILLQGMGAVEKAYKLTLADAAIQIGEKTTEAIEKAVKRARHGMQRPSAQESLDTLTTAGH